MKQNARNTDGSEMTFRFQISLNKRLLFVEKELQEPSSRSSKIQGK